MHPVVRNSSLSANSLAPAYELRRQEFSRLSARLTPRIETFRSMARLRGYTG
jgi:hypothetical protein